MDNVKCVDCGFLCLRQDGDLHCATFDTRDQKQHKSGFHFVCFEGENNLADEMTEWQPDSVPWDDWTVVVTKLRNCAKWTPYREGYTAKEHREMNIMEKVQHMAEIQRLKDEAWKRQVQRSNFVLSALGILAAIITAIVAPLVVEWVRGG